MNLSFAGCGFLGIYHVGVAVCFKKYAPHLLLEKISGASAGALAACCLLCDMPLGEQFFFIMYNCFKYLRIADIAPSLSENSRVFASIYISYVNILNFLYILTTAEYYSFNLDCLDNGLYNRLQTLQSICKQILLYISDNFILVC